MNSLLFFGITCSLVSLLVPRIFNLIFFDMNIYVGNLSYGVSDDNLREVFEAFGTVSSAKVITDKYSGRSKGFGFVEMDNDAEGQAAIEQLDGAEIDGRSVKVNEARPREDRPRGGGGGGYRGGGNRGGGNRY